MDAHIIPDPPDGSGVFAFTPDDLINMTSKYDVRAVSNYLRENNIVLQPGERLDPKIAKMFEL